jgi:hypothetical protein
MQLPATGSALARPAAPMAGRENLPMSMEELSIAQICTMKGEKREYPGISVMTLIL